MAAAKGPWEFLRCAVAKFRDGKLTCGTASQATHPWRKQLAAMLAMPEADVRCVYVDSSGSYGRNGHEDAAADAALWARAAGRPVRVQWLRADEHGWDRKGRRHGSTCMAGSTVTVNPTGSRTSSRATRADDDPTLTGGNS